jgi:Flp pilus assembly protein CpaB
VDVVVATTELRDGTVFTPDNVVRLTAIKAVPVAALPEGTMLVTGRAGLIGNRLTRTAHRGEWIAATDIGAKVPLGFRPGYQTVAIPFRVLKHGKEIVPGSLIDIVARFESDPESEVMVLLAGVPVLGVTYSEPKAVATLAADLEVVTFEVDYKQNELIVLANRYGHIEVVPSRPNRPAWDYNTTLARLQRLVKEASAPEREVAPFPRAVP